MRNIVRSNYTPKIGDYHDKTVHDPVNQKIWQFDCDGVYLDISRTNIFVANEFGDSETATLSQKFLTEEISKRDENVSEIKEESEKRDVEITKLVSANTKAIKTLEEGTDVAVDNLNQRVSTAETTVRNFGKKLDSETEARTTTDQHLQEQIDTIVASSDVKDIVGTYAELEAYDKSTLGKNDIIKVVKDETHEDAASFYRYNGTDFDYIGSEGPYLTSAQAAAIYTPMARTINGHDLAEDIELTAEDVNAATQEDLDELEEKVKEIELFKFPNMTIVGEPTIQAGQVSDFSKDNYLEFPFLVDFHNQPFEINFALTTGEDITTQQNILDSEFGLAFAIRNEHFVLAVSYNGTAWAFEKVGTLALLPNTTYRVKIEWNRINYKVSYSIDGGETYVDDINMGGTQQPFPRQMFIGVGKLADNAFGGSINLNYATLAIAGNVVWTGMDDAGLSTRLATDLSNIDAAGEERIKEIAAPSIVQTTGQSTTDIMSQKAVTDLVGNVENVLATLNHGEGI